MMYYTGYSFIQQNMLLNNKLIWHACYHEIGLSSVGPYRKDEEDNDYDENSLFQKARGSSGRLHGLSRIGNTK